MACFTGDIEMFTEVFIPDKKMELLEKLMKNSDSLSTVPAKKLGQSISLFKIQQLLLGNMFKCSTNGGSPVVLYTFTLYFLRK